MDRALVFGTKGCEFDSRRARKMNWKLYIVEAKDGSLYTGITVDIEKRIAVHNSGKGSKSLLGKRPVKLVYIENLETRSEALKREYEIKQLSRAQKLELIASNQELGA